VHRIEVHRIPTLAPDDVTGLRHLIDDGTVDPAEIICVLGKTEGNGCVNDWSRGFATVAYATLIAERLSDGDGGVSLTVRMGEAVEGIARACDRNPLTGSAPTWTDGTQAEYGVAKAAEVTLKARSRDHGHAAATPISALSR